MPRVLRLTMASSPTHSSARITQKPTRTPTPAALEIVELLELILFHLPPHVLLTTAQSVSKKWRSLILSSRRLQRALFFLADDAHRPSSPGAIYTPNPILARAFSAFLWFDPWMETAASGRVEHMDIALKMTPEKWQASMRYEGASWRRMLVAQPPVPEVVVTDWRVAPYYDDNFLDESHNPEGVRMGDVLLLEEK